MKITTDAEKSTRNTPVIEIVDKLQTPSEEEAP